MSDSIPPSGHNQGWIVTIPGDRTFTQPQFHFGDLVQWMSEVVSGVWARRTGQITGMHFTQAQIWQYQVRTAVITVNAESDIDILCAECELRLIQSLSRVQQQMTCHSEWQNTAQASLVLGLSPEQLRRLRRKGLFKVGHHCRDIFVPGSGLSRWQWHIVRCSKALDVPPEKRSISFK